MVSRYRTPLAALMALFSLIAWAIFMVAWQVGTWIEVGLAPIALYGAVWMLVFAVRVMRLGGEMLDSEWTAKTPDVLGTLAAGLWIARFPSPWTALLLVWGLTLGGHVFVLWRSEVTEPDEPPVTWQRMCKSVATSSLWDVGGMLLGLGIGRGLSPPLTHG